MTRIAYLLLCHRDPERMAAQARSLAARGDAVAIHFDGRAERSDFEHLQQALSGLPGIVFAERRVRCGWGEWSLVEATLVLARTALRAFPDASHFYLLSGDCCPTKSAAYCHSILRANDADFIESHDFFESDWIQTGLREERVVYRHWFNERAHKAWFYRTLAWQERLGLKRNPPNGISLRIGSQWWCLRRKTLEAILERLEERPDLARFFRTTWIPDEIFFQTIVRHVTPEGEIRNQSPTFLLFTDYGVPATFHNDHFDLLRAQESLFARKVSTEAHKLRQRLWAEYVSARTTYSTTRTGAKELRAEAHLGRAGKRFGGRIWEIQTSLTKREILILACKKWDIARQLVAALNAVEISAMGYVFDDPECDTPELGGIGTTLRKRTRHRRAVLHLLMEHLQTHRLLLCIDPARSDILEDLTSSEAELRLLEIECVWSDTELKAHSKRASLTQTPAELHQSFEIERDALAAVPVALSGRIFEGADREDNALFLAHFLAIPQAEAAALLESAQLFGQTPDDQ